MKTARLRNLISVLATIMPRGELPAVVNPDDTKIGTYCRITPTVAAETGRSLVDLRTGDLACICNENPELQFDCALVSKSKGVLTTDGVHPAERGIR